MRYFLSLAKTGSVTKAAELHHISAAAFSKAIKVFETEVGQKLTLPNGRGLILTDSAKSMIPGLEEVLRQIDMLKSSSADPSAQQRWLKISTFEVFSTYFLSEAISQNFEDTKVQVFEMIPGEMEKSVASYESDFALTYLPIPHPDLDYLKVTDISMGLFAKKDCFQDLDLKNLPFVVPLGPLSGVPTKVSGLDGWPDQAFSRNIQYKVQMMETALGLCRQGLAVAYLPNFVVRLHNRVTAVDHQLQQIHLPRRFPGQKQSVFLIKRKSDLEGDFAKRLAKSIRRICSI